MNVFSILIDVKYTQLFVPALGWIEMFDDDANTPYYFNERTGKTQKDNPLGNM